MSENDNKGVAEAEEIGTDISSKTGETLEKNEKGGYCTLKKIICLIVLVSVVYLASYLYFRLKNEEEMAFREQFEAQVDEMKLYMDMNTDAAFASVTGLSVLTTSLVKQLAEETEYPPGFITIPDAAQTLGEAKNTSNALVIAYLPKVMSENFKLWESYSRTHTSWLAEEQPGGPMNVTPTITEYIWEFTDYDWEHVGYRRLLDKVADGNPQTGLRGNEPGRKLTNRVIERPGDCTGGEERRRRVLNTDGNGDDLADPFHLYDDDDDDEYDDKYDPGPSAQVAAPRSDKFHTPVWQLAPVPVLDEEDPFDQVINYNLRDRVVFAHAVDYIERTRQPVFLDVCDQASWFLIEGHSEILQTAVVAPVFDDVSEDASIVGYHVAVVPWMDFFKNSRGSESMDMIAVMRNSCGEQFSVELKGDSVRMLGESDEYDLKLDTYYEKSFPFAQQYLVPGYEYEEELCVYTVSFYPTEI